MRGRTNIPPRVGGIVNGIVREYKVAEESGINIGDYIQIVPNGTYSERVDLKSANSKPSASELFTLSDGTELMMYCTVDDEIIAKTFNVSSSGFNNLLEKKVKGQLALNSVTSMEYIQMSADTFVLIAGASGVYTVFRVDYINNDFTAIQLGTIEGADRQDYSTNGVYNKHYCISWDGDTFMFLLGDKIHSYSIQDSILTELGAVNVVKLALGIYRAGNKIILSRSDKYNTDKQAVDVFDVSSGLLTQRYSVPYPDEVGMYNPTMVIPMYQSHCLLCFGENHNTVGYILTLGESAYSYSEKQFLENESDEYTYSNWSSLGEEFLMTDIGTRGSKGVSIHGAILRYDRASNSMIYGNTFLIESEQSPYNNSYRDFIKNAVYLSALDKVVLQIQTHWYSSSSSYGVNNAFALMSRQEQGTLIPDEEFVRIKKYETIINGVAKTAGSLGEVVEVYSPE